MIGTIILTVEEANSLIKLIDVAVKTKGLAIAGDAVILNEKIKEAFAVKEAFAEKEEAATNVETE